MYKGHLRKEDREKIYLYINQGRKCAEISRFLNRDRSVILREIERNKGPNGEYQPFTAHQTATERKSQANKRNPCKNYHILRYVKEKLDEDWSPEEISGRIGIDIPGMSICHETIYQFIYATENKRMRLWLNLRRARPRRMKRFGRRPQKEMIPNRTFINERPDYINERKEIGHWESDNMLGKRELCGISVLAERKSRFLLLGKLNDLGAETKKENLIGSLDSLPYWMKRTITFDNGTENKKHEIVSDVLGVLTYFCHPYHSWEKGTVENIIGLVRQYLPKGESLMDITDRDLNWIAQRMNNRPRKCLGYKTPYEVFYGELNVAF